MNFFPHPQNPPDPAQIPHDPGSFTPKFFKKLILSTIFFIFLCLILSPFTYADFTPTDDDIVDVIETQINLNNDAAYLDVQVICHDGVVRFSGTVDSYAEAHRLVDIAYSTAGVRYIDITNLKIDQNE